MALGNIKRDWTLVYAPSGFQKRDITAGQYAMSGCPAAMSYLLKFPGAVYTAIPTTLDADILIGCEKDVFSIKPDFAKFKGFKKHTPQSVGFVLENGLGDLRLYDPEDNSGMTITHHGAIYHNVGSITGKGLYGRLDRTAISALHAGANLTEAQLNVYETSMKKGVIAGKSTGSDGIKLDQGSWVIKITISIASAHGMDNVLSPLANPVVVGDDILLNFNQLARRH